MRIKDLMEDSSEEGKTNKELIEEAYAELTGDEIDESKLEQISKNITSSDLLDLNAFLKNGDIDGIDDIMTSILEDYDEGEFERSREDDELESNLDMFPTDDDGERLDEYLMAGRTNISSVANNNSGSSNGGGDSSSEDESTGGSVPERPSNGGTGTQQSNNQDQADDEDAEVNGEGEDEEKPVTEHEQMKAWREMVK